jgi:hypothetical protein
MKTKSCMKTKFLHLLLEFRAISQAVAIFLNINICIAHGMSSLLVPERDLN